MFLQALMGLILFVLVVCQAFGAGPSPMESFFSSVAKKTGLSVEEVRKRAVEALDERTIESIRETGNFTKEDLALIGRGEELNLDPARTNALVNLIQESPAFRVSTGLEALRLRKITQSAGMAFEAMASEKTDVASDLSKALNRAEIAKLDVTVLETTNAALRAKIERGDDVTESKAKLKANTTSMKASTGKLVQAQNKVFFAATSLLSARQIPFTMHAQGGHSVITIDMEHVAEGFRDAVDSELAGAIPAQSGIRRRPVVVIDPARLDESSILDESTNTLSLGTDFLRRIK